MKKLFFIISLIFGGISLSAQSVDDVTLVVSGDGATKEDATHVALRSAIEQAYGVFVSANTEILNDELVKDEIATVTSGNVKSYKELSAALLPNGNHMVSLQAVVSTKKLAAYAESKGASCEFAGATFGANVKLLELNRKNTTIAFENLLKQCNSLAPYLFETNLNIGDPAINGDLPILITLYSTPNTWEFSNLIVSTLDALKLNTDQIQQLIQMGAGAYEIELISTTLETRIVNGHTRGLVHNYLGLPGFRENPPMKGWYWDADIKQPHRGAYGTHGYTNYYYAAFPHVEFSNMLKKAYEGYYIIDNLGNKYTVDFKRLVIDEKIFPHKPNYNEPEEDLILSCYLFKDAKVLLPYSFIKPYVEENVNSSAKANKKRKNSSIEFNIEENPQKMIYPKKEIGQKEIILNIPIEVLSKITNLEIKKQ